MERVQHEQWFTLNSGNYVIVIPVMQDNKSIISPEGILQRECRERDVFTLDPATNVTRISRR